jgi:hypothetical protein
MACIAQDLVAEMNQFVGGSEDRYRHAFNRKLIYTGGVQAMAERAGAYWLIDTIAISIAPIYAKAWLADETGIGVVTLKVFTDAERAQDRSLPAARVSLSLKDEAPAAFTQDIALTDFPEGEWQLFLGTDQIARDSYVTTVCLPQEY